MLKNNINNDESGSKLPSASSSKKKITFKLVKDLEITDDDDQLSEISLKINPVNNLDESIKKFKQKENQLNEKYSPLVEFNSTIYLEYYTCKEFNKKVILSRLKLISLFDNYH
jgi:hypothetical protein